MLNAHLKRQPNNSGMTFEFHDSSTRKSAVKELRPEVDVGDSRTDVFKPSIYLSGWNEECFLKIHLQPESARPVIDDSTSRMGKLEYNSSVGKHRFTVIPDKADNDAFEWEIVFDSIPTNNVLTFDIEHQGLSFHYQGNLTQTEIEKGYERSDDVVGSYAVYHSTKRDNHAYADGTQENYGTGKFCHIYRLKLIDNNSDESWVDMNIDTIANKMTVTMDKRWLRNASYPVILDPTFGITSAGASNVNSPAPGSTDALVSATYVASTGDTVTELHAWSSNYGGTTTIDMGLYDFSGGVPVNRVLTGQSVSVSNGSPAQDNSITGLSQSLTNGTEYCIAYGNSSGTVRLTFDNVTSASSQDNSGIFPATWSESSTSNARMAVYAFYTVSVGGISVTPDPIDMVLATVNPTVELGDLSITPSAITQVLTTVNPTVVLGGISLTPTAISQVFATIDPTIILGALSVTPAVITMVLATVDPTVNIGTGDVTITPTAISQVLSTINPAVELGNISTIPPPISQVLATVDPTVDVTGGDVSITPVAISFVLSTIDPTVLFGSMTATPTAVSMVFSTIDPTVDAGAIDISGDARDAVYVLLQDITLEIGIDGIATKGRNAVFTLIESVEE